MAKKIKFSPKSHLSFPAPAGSEVVYLYQALHDQYGAITSSANTPFWQIHLEAAKFFKDQLKKLDSQVLGVAPGDNRSRYLSDELAYSIYIQGVNMVLHMILAIESFCISASSHFKLYKTICSQKTDEKLKTIASAMNINLIGRKEYDGDFQKIYAIRHEISHPENIFNYLTQTISNDWDAIPINWFISGRAHKACENVIALFEEVILAFDNFIAKHPPRPATAKNVVRGIGYDHSVKKPSKPI